jgi:hypothetical protein
MCTSQLTCFRRRVGAHKALLFWHAAVEAGADADSPRTATNARTTLAARTTPQCQLLSSTGASTNVEHLSEVSEATAAHCGTQEACKFTGSESATASGTGPSHWQLCFQGVSENEFGEALTLSWAPPPSSVPVGVVTVTVALVGCVQRSRPSPGHHPVVLQGCSSTPLEKNPLKCWFHLLCGPAHSRQRS